MPIHEVYDNRELIEAILRENGVNPSDAQSYQRLSRTAKDAIAEHLASRSGAEPSYCNWVVSDYFGQKRSHERLRAFSSIAAKSRLCTMRRELAELLEATGIGKRTKVGKAIIAAVDQIADDVPYGAFRLQPGAGAEAQLRALRETLSRHGFAHLLPAQRLRVVKA